jgi:hypothetical protein
MALLSPNYFAQGMNAFDDQTQRLNQFAQSRASKEAGQAIAAGDYAGGANAFNRAGMVEQGHNVLADQQVLEDRQRKAQDDVADRAQRAKAIQIEGLSKITEALQAVPEGQREPWLKAQLPLIQQLGLPADQFASLDESHLADASLGPWKAMLGKAQADYTLGEGQRRFSGATGKVIGEGAPKPQEYLVLPEGGKAIPKPTNGATVGNPAPAFAPTAATTPAAVDGAIGETGATVTSGYRTPEHNAEVGGVPNSRHLTNQARDLVPPAGATVAQLAAEMRRRLPGAKVIEESDHVHVQWGGMPPPAPPPPPDPNGPSVQHVGPQPGDPAGTLYGNPKPHKETARPATPQEKAAYGIPADVPAQMRPDGSIDVISGTGAAQKRVPPKIQSGYADNAKSMAQIDQAIAAIRANPEALGLKNMFGDTVNQRLDPKGVSTRAAVANIGSQIIHDRSGAAVTLAEQPRLLPFIPAVNDRAEAAIVKLQKLKEQYQNANDQIDIQFGEDSGYAPLGGTGRSPPPKASPAAPSPKAPPISALKADHITTFANGQRWTLRNGQPVRVP